MKSQKVDHARLDNDVKKIHEYLSGLFGCAVDRLTKDDIDRWAEELCSYASEPITKDFAIEIATSKIQYHRKLIYDMEYQYAYENITKNMKERHTLYKTRVENGIVEKLLVKPLKPIRNTIDANNAILAFQRHKLTDYEYRLKEGKLISDVLRKNGKGSMVSRDYAKERMLTQEESEKTRFRCKPYGYTITRSNGNHYICKREDIIETFRNQYDTEDFISSLPEDPDERLKFIVDFCDEQAKKTVSRINKMLINKYYLFYFPSLNEIEQEIVAGQISKIYFEDVYQNLVLTHLCA